MSCFAHNVKFGDTSRPPQLVLAGDPKQLGPIVRSDSAKIGGLDISILERILNAGGLYAKQVSDRLISSLEFLLKQVS